MPETASGSPYGVLRIILLCILQFADHGGTEPHDAGAGSPPMRPRTRIQPARGALEAEHACGRHGPTEPIPRGLEALPAPVALPAWGQAHARACPSAA